MSQKCHAPPNVTQNLRDGRRTANTTTQDSIHVHPMYFAVEHGEWWVVGGRYHDKIVSSSGQGKCTCDVEKSSHKRDFSQSNRRENTSSTSSGSYWDSSTWTYLEFEPKKLRRKLWNLKCWEARPKHTYWTFYGDNLQAFSLPCCSRVIVKLKFDMLHM